MPDSFLKEASFRLTFVLFVSLIRCLGAPAQRKMVHVVDPGSIFFYYLLRLSVFNLYLKFTMWIMADIAEQTKTLTSMSFLIDRLDKLN